MKRLLTILLCCRIAGLCAQNVDITPNSQNMALHDTLVMPTDNKDSVPISANMIAETYQIPAYELYDHYWDVENLYSRQLTIPFVNERLMILLVQVANHPFQMPCVFDEMLMPYGTTKQGDFHTGIDLKVESKTLVKCCFDGVVRMAKYYGQYGKVVVVRHYNGLETVYAHLDKIYVRPGQIVNAGNVIGRAGQTGNASRPVLHFEIRFMNEYFNPELAIDFENGTLIKNTLVLKPDDFTIPRWDDKDNVSPAAIKTVPEYHIVKRGETLYRISAIYHISVDRLLEINNLRNGDQIQVGQKLRVK